MELVQTTSTNACFTSYFTSSGTFTQQYTCNRWRYLLHRSSEKKVVYFSFFFQVEKLEELKPDFSSNDCYLLVGCAQVMIVEGCWLIAMPTDCCHSHLSDDLSSDGGGRAAVPLWSPWYTCTPITNPEDCLQVKRSDRSVMIRLQSVWILVFSGCLWHVPLISEIRVWAPSKVETWHLVSRLHPYGGAIRLLMQGSACNGCNSLPGVHSTGTTRLPGSDCSLLDCLCSKNFLCRKGKT